MEMVIADIRLKGEHQILSILFGLESRVDVLRVYVVRSAAAWLPVLDLHRLRIEVVVGSVLFKKLPAESQECPTPWLKSYHSIGDGQPGLQWTFPRPTRSSPDPFSEPFQIDRQWKVTKHSYCPVWIHCSSFSNSGRPFGHNGPRASESNWSNSNSASFLLRAIPKKLSVYQSWSAHGLPGRDNQKPAIHQYERSTGVLLGHLIAAGMDKRWPSHKRHSQRPLTSIC
jgi:hypothetical protein